MTELTKDLLEKITKKLKEYEIPPVTRAILTRDAFMFGTSLIPMDEPSYIICVPPISRTWRAELTRDWFMYGDCE